MRPIDLAVDETIAFILAHIAAPPLRILDVGCGDGLVARRLQARGYDVVWFYGITRLLDSCQVPLAKEHSFVTELLQSSGEFAFWQQSHEHDLHTVPAMWSALAARFQVLSKTRAPCLYRYLCQVLMENAAGYAIATQALDIERRLAQLDTITLIGHRFVGVSHERGTP